MESYAALTDVCTDSHFQTVTCFLFLFRLQGAVESCSVKVRGKASAMATLAGLVGLVALSALAMSLQSLDFAISVDQKANHM